jgi:cytochrome c5
MDWRRSLLMSVALLGLASAPAGAVLAADASAGGSGAPPAGQPDPDVMRKWSRSCALCHVDGNGGAPRVGHAEEWQPRLAQGRDLLLDHTLNGFGKMPPLGYCMSCEAEDFRALIEFMAGAPE